ncbi:MAG: dockerin type I domain-containing protein [Candidatus Poribacteria bacterium]|nr:dockerin type I domain-containing protein [Candidatus Poribacteria bacterium]
MPEQATGVESGLQNTTHTIPDLDGKIYLKSTTKRHDVNGDGVVNVLDLVAVANAFGQ